MNPVVRKAFADAVSAALEKLRTDETPTEPFLVWRSEGPGRWAGEWQDRPSFRLIDRVDWDGESLAIGAAMTAHHPDHCGQVGTPSLGIRQIGAGNWLRSTVATLWERHAGAAVPGDAVDAILEDISAFIDSPTVRLRYRAPVVNLRLPNGHDTVRLTEDVVIRRLTDDEVTEEHGGLFSLSRRSPLSIPEAAFVGTLDEPKTLGQPQSADRASLERLAQQLRRAIEALRTFKAGSVGCGSIRLWPERFSPFLTGSITLGAAHDYVPAGSYELLAADVEELRQHAVSIFADLHQALQVACSRLSSASVRLDPADILIDSVVGLEAILLGSSGNAEYRGELRFRFSLNYAMLNPDPAQRRRDFRTARSLYDLRSTIAHGGARDDSSVKVGQATMSLREAAFLARDMLRTCVKRFLPQGANPDFVRSEYWETLYFPGEVAATA